mgnify:CR=1 FL=1
MSSTPWTYLPSHGGPLQVDRAFYDRLAQQTDGRALVDGVIDWVSRSAAPEAATALPTIQ